jgi:solute:Na+ symporter, SSS family
LSIYLVVLALYATALMALGLWIGRRVRGGADFFVASRQLGPGLIFSTMLAANIGAGSTVGATAQGFATGLAAAWWVGSAAIGSVVMAFLVGPAMRRVAASKNLTSLGDYLEFRYDRRVRAVISLLLWVGSIAILAAQLIAIGTILNYVAGIPFGLGCAIGGLVVSVYFSAGGLLTSAWVNVVQLTVKMAGFAVALPLAVNAVGGWHGLTAIGTDRPLYWTFWRADVALGYLFAFAPAFVISPGLLQKVLGAHDDRAVRLGVGWNAVGLALYAVVPALLGIAARGLFPELADSQQALPAILVRALPPLVGAIGLAAVFSAEVSAADAVLLMLTTSLSQDLYKRYVAPQASDAQVLRIARIATIASSALGIGLAIASRSIVDVLTIFYTLMSVSLFVPVVGGLFVRRTNTASALAAITSGVAAMLINHVATGGRGWGMITPALGGLVAALVAWAAALLFASDSRRGGRMHGNAVQA